MKNKIAAIVLAVSLTTGGISAGASTFSDVENDKYKESIEYLNEIGVINGVGNNMFAPEQTITRGDFSVMLAKALGLKGHTDNMFSDVTAQDYYCDAVNAVSQAGILQGMGGGLFCPQNEITVQECAAISVRAYEYKKNMKISYGEFLHEYSDGGKVSEWAKSSMNKALTMNFISADNGMITPMRKVSRKEAAMLMAVLMNSLTEDIYWDNSAQTRIIQNRRGNIFTKGEDVTFTLKTGWSLIECVINDFWNETVSHEFIKNDSGAILLNYGYLNPGYYNAAFYSTDKYGMKYEIAKTTFCILEPCDFSDVKYSPFGMNTHADRSSTGWSYDLLKEASLIGVKSVRDTNDWGATETGKGVYKSSHAQWLQGSADKYGMSVLSVTGYTNKFYDNNATPWSEDGRQGFANYSKAIFDLYGGRLEKQEMFNEWWGPQFGDKGDGPADSLPETYVPLVKKVYETVKKAYPNAELLGEFGSPAEWNEPILNLGIIDYMDAAAYHVYPNYSSYEYVKKVASELREQLAKYNKNGKNIPMYLTETGCATSTNNYGVPEEEQAYYVPKLFCLALSEGTERIYWYDLIDDGNSDSEHEHRFGILHANGSDYGSYTPKPAYVAYGVLARTIKDMRFKEAVNKDGIECYTFAGENEPVNVIYYRGGEEQITVYADKPIYMIDMMGNERLCTPVDGKLYFTVSDESIYLRGEIKNFEKGMPYSVTSDKWAAVGEPIELTVHSEEPGGEAVIGGVSYKLNENILLSPAQTAQQRRIVIDLKRDGKCFGRLVAKKDINEKYECSVYSGVEAVDNIPHGTVNIKVNNISPDPLHLTGVQYSFNEVDGQKMCDEVIEGGQSKVISADVGVIEGNKKYPVKVQLMIDGEFTGKIDKETQLEFNLLRKKTITVDGVLDELPKDWEINLLDGSVNSLASDGSHYNGEEDLSGKAWVTYDDENLYFAADIIDNMHETTFENDQIWRNDSVQVAIYCPDNEKYDTATKFFEIGLSAFEGNERIWQWRKITEDKENDFLEGSVYKRTENGSHIIYEFSVPWKTLGINPNINKNISMTILVNDEDKGVRKTALSWGDGVLSGKDPMKFRSFVLVGEVDKDD